jgi:tetratricopeptide (TPR) repeat protein
MRQLFYWIIIIGGKSGIFYCHGFSGIMRRHSTDDLTSWGHYLMQQGEKEKAIEVLKLNALLYPGNTDVYESLAEAYEAAGNKEFAIKNYKRALELSPGNTQAGDHLKKLLPSSSEK